MKHTEKIQLICQEINNNNHVNALGETYCQALSNFPIYTQAFLLLKEVEKNIKKLKPNDTYKLLKLNIYLEYLETILNLQN